MTLRYFLTLVAGLAIFFACDRIPENFDIINGQDVPEPVMIDVQPFSDIPKEYVEYVEAELKKIYPHVQVNKPIPFPAKAFYTPRKRYRADTLIDFLRDLTPAGHVTIGLTGKDISHTKGEHKDFGLMGLGFCPGKACVASYFRLSKKNAKDQFFKVSIHELGHTQGLPHCPTKYCFMRDAEGKNHTNEEKEFCDKCRKHLEQRGWQFH